MDRVYERCYGIDVHKKIVVACFRCGRKQELREKLENWNNYQRASPFSRLAHSKRMPDDCHGKYHFLLEATTTSLNHVNLKQRLSMRDT